MVKKNKRTLVCMAAALCLPFADTASELTGGEIAQIETALGVTLSSNDVSQLSEIVYPTNMPQWRIDAYNRINTHRKADLDIRVVDQNGDPVEGAEISVKLKSNDFKFGGICNVMDLTDASGNLSAEGATSNDWQRIVTNLFNAVGLNNGFKPKITGQHKYIPGFLSWANAHSLPVRGHTLMWPGGGTVADLDSGVPGVDYGDHLSNANTSDYAHYNVLGAVDIYKNSTRGPADKAALKAEVDGEIAEWASQWDVYEWDVMNEVVGNTLLQEILGYEQMAEWFKIAESNKVSAGTGLLINEYKIISADYTDGDEQYDSRKATYTERINSVITNGGPITGIGFQSRYKYGHIDPAIVCSRLDDFATFYPDMTFSGTEFEIMDGQLTGGTNYVYSEFTRAQMTEEIMTVYFSHDQVKALNAWSFMSATTDIPEEKAAALAWYDGSVKLNGLVWYYLHRIRYSTDAELASGLDGHTGLRAFKGDYEVTVTYKGQELVSSLTLTNDESVVMTLSSTTVDDPNTASVIDAWSYDGLTNGAGLASAVSTGLVGGASTPDHDLASIQNETVRWQSDGVTDSLYRNIEPSSSIGAGSGRYQVSMDYLDADFTASAAITNGSGRVALGVRRTNDNTDVNFRLVFDSGNAVSPEFRLEATDDLGNNQELAAFPGATLDHLSVRAVYDFDTAGTVGSYKVYYRLNGGSEVEAYAAGQLPAGFTLDTLRLMVQTDNGGVNWITGDRIYTDNLVLRSLGVPPPPPAVIALEDWQMNESSGTNLSGLVNSAGSALWSGDKDNVQTDGSGNLRVTQGTDASDNLYRNATLTQNGVTTGVYQLSFAYPAATLVGGDASGANLGFGMRDETTGVDLFLVRLQRQNSELRLQTRIGSTNTDIYDFNATSLPGELAVRAVVDLDTDRMDLYYSIGGGSEALAADIAVNDGVMDALRMAGSLNTTDFGAADFIEVDYLTLSQINESASPQNLYQNWLVNFSTIGNQTNLTDNPDGDAFNNLTEYGLGGDPTVADSVLKPVFRLNGDSFDFIHVQRSDAAARGLSYSLETSPTLTPSAWTNAGYLVIDTNLSYGVDGFEEVTNRIPVATKNSQFIRLRIELTR